MGEDAPRARQPAGLAAIKVPTGPTMGTARSTPPSLSTPPVPVPVPVPVLSAVVATTRSPRPGRPWSAGPQPAPRDPRGFRLWCHRPGPRSVIPGRPAPGRLRQSRGRRVRRRSRGTAPATAVVREVVVRVEAAPATATVRAAAAAAAVAAAEADREAEAAEPEVARSPPRRSPPTTGPRSSRSPRFARPTMPSTAIEGAVGSAGARPSGVT